MNSSTNIRGQKNTLFQENNTIVPLFFDSLPIGVDIVDKNGKILYANDLLKRKYGEKILGKKCFQIYNDTKQQCHYCPLKTKLIVGEKKIVQKEEDEHVVHTTIWYKGEIALLEIFSDITSQENSSQLLHKTAFAQMLQSITTATDEAKSVEEVMEICLKSICKYTGWPLGHIYIPDSQNKILESSHIWSFQDPQQFIDFQKITEKTVLKKGEGLPGRVWEKKTPLWIEDITKDSNFPRIKGARDLGVRGAFAFPILEDKKIVAIFEFFSDKTEIVDEALISILEHLIKQITWVTERKRSVISIKESEAFLNQIFENTSDGIWVINKDKITLRSNQAMAKILGLKDAKSLEGRSIFEFVEKDERKKFEENTKKSQKDGLGQNYEIDLLTKNRTKASCLFSTAPFKNAHGEIIGSFAIVKDITEKKEFSRKIEEQNIFLKTLLDTIPHPIFFKNTQGKYLGCNTAFLTMIGKTREEVEGKGVEELYPEELANVYKVMDAELYQKKGLQVYEGKVKIKDNQYRDTLFYKTIYYDIHGKSAGIVGIAVDITDQKRAQQELEKSNRELKKLDLMKGEFISIASHELKTPLSVLNSYLSLLLDSSFGNLSSTQENFALKMSQSVKTLIDLVDDLLDISILDLDKMIFNFEKIDIEISVLEILKEMKVLFKDKNISLSFQKSLKKKYYVKADKIRLSQVLSNLLTNALKFTPESGSVSVNLNLSDTYICVSIKDSGIGISQEMQKTIFEKFTQAHSALERNYQGTGLGLAITKTLIEKMGGNIWVESDEGKGATFSFTLPLYS